MQCNYVSSIDQSFEPEEQRDSGLNGRFLFHRPEFPRLQVTIEQMDLTECMSALMGAVQAEAKSGLDILAEFMPDATMFSQSAMIRELEAILKIKVDLVSDRGLLERIRESEF